MKRTKITLAVLFAGVTLAGTVQAEVVAPGAVAFNEDGAVDMSLTGVPGDVMEGAKVVSTKSMGNCIACHEITDLADVPFHGEVGPLLDGAGDRWTAAELRGILVNAKVLFEDTVMPSFYKTDGFNRLGKAYTGKAHEGEVEPLLSAQQIEDVVAYLMTLK
ncbi:sulfur oxidation c-type cytochrome SoxX [Aliiroseovarius crassostreae]|uniref:sulfur oxidation c-type cytochrome SoxX n=1 Tax=Aliiroseovarius crassostreae TaxID=154981 RepID=UPI0021AE86E5|nr:sulfur oxidation c-type cytochrome SoxX [Aliiroseovarius crassostreae]UWP90453.1 sulfur oxidation c-type cytochrome SoxX [Aliiroseovarius crassostreae]UWQ03118.1 sulfur oxidation c-type cytochrome SoxX [Aliiroseovarius crassostreae]UWQ05861.1 sulfur oxidation c-type cytochrome SoxX [Aliiroseovarius crassostreae]